MSSHQSKNDQQTTRESASSKAAALKYDGQNAPKLVAKGTGATADAIIREAAKHDIYLHNDPVLLEVLSRLELGDEIPRELYIAVAKIIAFAYFLQGKHPEYQDQAAKSLALEHLPGTQPVDWNDP